MIQALFLGCQSVIVWEKTVEIHNSFAAFSQPSGVCSY